MNLNIEECRQKADRAAAKGKPSPFGDLPQRCFVCGEPLRGDCVAQQGFHPRTGGGASLWIHEPCAIRLAQHLLSDAGVPTVVRQGKPDEDAAASRPVVIHIGGQSLMERLRAKAKSKQLIGIETRKEVQ